MFTVREPKKFQMLVEWYSLIQMRAHLKQYIADLLDPEKTP